MTGSRSLTRATDAAVKRRIDAADVWSVGGRHRAIGQPAGYIRKRLRPLQLILAAYVVFAITLVLVVWRFVRPGGHAAPLWELFLVVPLVSYWFLRREPGLRREVRSWWDGRTGEIKVARILDPLLGCGYEVLHDLDIGRGNVDHVVVGLNGVFAIETKAWRGRVYLGRGGRLMCNGFDKDDARRQAQGGAMAIRDRLGAKNGPYVTAVIALTRTRLHLGAMDLRSVAVLEAKALPDWILSRPARLERPDVDRIRDSLVPLTAGQRRA